jgi:hypothetical protein
LAASADMVYTAATVEADLAMVADMVADMVAASIRTAAGTPVAEAEAADIANSIYELTNAIKRLLSNCYSFGLDTLQ